MKTRFFFLISCLLGFSFAYGADALSYTIIKSPYTFTTYFEMIGKNDTYEGRVVSDYFHLRTTYDLYDSKGDSEAQGICRALSLGCLFTWAREIDIYDTQGNHIGLIDGKAVTTASAKYHIYNERDLLVAVAYLNQDHNSFTLMDPTKNERTLGFLKRNLAENGKDDWDVILYDKKTLDSRILKIFSAFVEDHQDSF